MARSISSISSNDRSTARVWIEHPSQDAVVNLDPFAPIRVQLAVADGVALGEDYCILFSVDGYQPYNTTLETTIELEWVMPGVHSIKVVLAPLVSDQCLPTTTPIADSDQTVEFHLKPPLGLAHRGEELHPELQDVQRYLGRAEPPPGEKHTFDATGTVFVINLERRPDRWERVTSHLSELGMPAPRRFVAVDGSALKITPPISYLFRRNNFGSKLDVFGCALSHLSVWMTMMHERLPYALILEDDVQLAPNFSRDWRDILEFLAEEEGGPGVPQRGGRETSAQTQPLLAELGWGGDFLHGEQLGWDYVCLGPTGSFDTLRTFDETEIFPGLQRYRWRHLCYAHAYALSLSGAEKLVNWVASKGVYCGMDWFITEHYHMMKSYAAQPSLAAQDSEVEGDIAH